MPIELPGKTPRAAQWISAPDARAPIEVTIAGANRATPITQTVEVIEQPQPALIHRQKAPTSADGVRVSATDHSDEIAAVIRSG
jgi:hypothetical protein